LKYFESLPLSLPYLPQRSPWRLPNTPQWPRQTPERETPSARFMLRRRGYSSSSRCAIRTQFYLTSWRCIL